MAQKQQSHPPALEGLRVADFSAGIAGPHVGLLLAHHGADAIKLESLEGDWSRTLGCSIDEYSPFAVYYNRGKRSLAVDLKTDAGRAVALEIARQSDIVVESFRPGVMKRLGLDHAAMHQVNPSLI